MQLLRFDPRAVRDGHDDEGKEVASGIYFYRMTAGTETARKNCALF